MNAKKPGLSTQRLVPWSSLRPNARTKRNVYDTRTVKTGDDKPPVLSGGDLLAEVRTV